MFKYNLYDREIICLGTYNKTNILNQWDVIEY